MDEQGLSQSSSDGSPPAGCPVFHGYDPVSREAVTDPEPWMSRARKENPVFFMPEHDLWAVTRHADVLTVLKDTETFSSLRAHDIRVEMPAAIREEVGDDYLFPLISQLAVIDPPQHTRIRKLIQPAWTPRAIEGYGSDIRAIADDLIDRFVASGRTDLMASYARPIPPLVIAKIMGAPPEMAPKFTEWIPSFFMLSGRASLPEEETLKAWGNVLAFERYVRQLIADHRAEPQEDLTTELINARGEDGEPALSDQEIMGNILGFIGAGSDTSAMLIAHTLYLLLKHPEQWERVKEDRDLLKKAVEETMRFRGSTVSVKRTTTREVTLSGVTIPADADIWVNLASANFDAEVFENPDEFNIDRPEVGQHLGFGKWTHFCLGSPLARVEARIALERLIDRLPDIRIAHDQGPLEYSLNMIIPGIEGLEIEWDPAVSLAGSR